MSWRSICLKWFPWLSRPVLHHRRCSRFRWKDQVAQEKCLTVCPPMANDDDEYNDDVSNIHLYAYMRWVQFDFLSNLQMICIQCCSDLTLNLWEIECVFARYWSSRRSAVHGNVESVVWQELEDSYTTMIRASIFEVKWHEAVQNCFLVGREQTFGWTVAGGQWLTSNWEFCFGAISTKCVCRKQSDKQRMPRRQHFWAGWFFTTTWCWQGARWFKVNCKCCLLFTWSGEFEMRISAELHAKKHLVVRYRQIEICKTAWLKMWSAFIYVYFVDNSDAVKANSALQEDTKSQISDDLLAFILLAFFKIIWAQRKKIQHLIWFM